MNFSEADNPDRYKVFSTASSQRISHRSSTKIRRTSKEVVKAWRPILPFSLGSQSPKLFQISQDIHCWTKRHFGSISASYKSAVEKSWAGRLVNADINGAWNISPYRSWRRVAHAPPTRVKWIGPSGSNNFFSS